VAAIQLTLYFGKGKYEFNTFLPGMMCCGEAWLVLDVVNFPCPMFMCGGVGSLGA
jgi:hypothetical protein